MFIRSLPFPSDAAMARMLDDGKLATVPLPGVAAKVAPLTSIPTVTSSPRSVPVMDRTPLASVAVTSAAIRARPSSCST